MKRKPFTSTSFLKRSNKIVRFKGTVLGILEGSNRIKIGVDNSKRAV